MTDGEEARAVPRLIGDIGATNARFALVEAAGLPRQVRILACEEHPSLEAAIAAYLAAEAPTVPPREAALAVASPITGDEVAFTNHPWAFSIKAIQQALAFERLVIVNDFTANAMAIPHLGADHLLPVGRGAGVRDAPLGVLGPGSGLGVAGLIPAAAGWTPIPGEGGHVTMAPASIRESVVLDRMRRRFDHVSAERVLSGPGLVNLYNTLCEIDGVPAAGFGPAQIADPGIGAGEPRCREALEMFCCMLGTIAGNLALTLGARGGIYIAGGIVPRLGARFAESGFRARFEDKGRFRSYLAAIPTLVILHPTPAFLGLAALLAAARS